MLKRADVKVGFACNNHCTFCVQGDKRNKFKPRKIEEIREIIQKEYDDGARYIVFTGGEPTVHPDLVESVRFAKNLGFTQIQIQSNGRRFSDMEYLKQLLDAGATEFSPAIHGLNPHTHDSQVGSPGAWKEVIEGLVNLKRMHQVIVINSVITEQNYKEIPGLAKLLVKLGVQQFQFAFVHILGTAQKNKDTVVPKKSDVIPYVHEALDIARKSGIAAYTEAIPYCFMKGYEWAIAENIMPETTVVDAEYTIESYADYRWSEGKAKGPQCAACIKNKVCEGPWKEYPEMYGWTEFHPILATSEK